MTPSQPLPSPLFNDSVIIWFVLTNALKTTKGFSLLCRFCVSNHLFPWIFQCTSYVFPLISFDESSFWIKPAIRRTFSFKHVTNQSNYCSLQNVPYNYFFILLFVSIVFFFTLATFKERELKNIGYHGFLVLSIQESSCNPYPIRQGLNRQTWC